MKIDYEHPELLEARFGKFVSGASTDPAGDNNTGDLEPLEAKDLKTLKLDDLIGSLLTYKIMKNG